MSQETTETYKLTGLSQRELLSTLYTRYGRKLYSYGVQSWKLGEDEAWELTYKTLYRVTDTQGRYAFESEEKFASFVFRIFINYLKNHYKAAKKLSEKFSLDFRDDVEHAGAAHEEQGPASTDPRLKILKEELENMEDWQRIVLLMRSDGRSYMEIARFVDKPENQLKVYYQRLKEQITKKLHERL